MQHGEQVQVSPVDDRECAQVSGGDLQAIVGAGIDAMVEAMLCVGVTLLGGSCAG